MVLVCGQARNLSDPVLLRDHLFAVSGTPLINTKRASPFTPVHAGLLASPFKMEVA